MHELTKAQARGIAFEYALEMYKPAAKAPLGYFALPVHHGDRLIGKVDAVADRKAAPLRVNAIHEDVEITRPIAKGCPRCAR